ncbi:GNAT family N-acetyltransferase [Streptomyces oceani]|uniref:N-acetyltransferase domain-containing protein n=1 Tax=Streptomyces oceani TaxID=1075402 RepID=A0A1E7JX69_9ACTN|nr:N-acetyltransferase [Streptomyces oceani]OEU96199.1 hypothetical protein AN216_21740 [Streptomyces oceani]
MSGTNDENGTSGDCLIRPVRADEWPAARELRLASLTDPMASVAFMETHERALARPEAYWRERTANGSERGPNRQFVAEKPTGDWAGTATVILEEAGTQDFMGQRVERRQAHLVAVFVRAEARGGTVARDLVRAAVGWAMAEEGVSRVRLLVHRNNERAEAFYRKAGFVHTHSVADEREMEYRPDL